MTDPRTNASPAVAVLTPLRFEKAAVAASRAGLRAVRTGMGPTRAARAPLPEDLDAVVVAGVAGGVDPAVRPGDLVVASELRDDRQGVLPLAPPDLLAGALRRSGLRVHVGPIAGVTGLVSGADRIRLATDGVLAVDMESADLTRRLRPGTPMAVVRAVVDTHDKPLVRPGTAIRGVRALDALRRAGPVLADWAAAVGAREVLLASPRSFCAGVDRAIEAVRRELTTHGRPIYVRRQIVHNSHVVQELEDLGAVFVTEIDEVPEGERVVLAAHGVAPQVRADAESRGLTVVDATCPLVAKVHAEVRRYARQGATVLVVGHAAHEEVEGTLGEAPEQAMVVEDIRQAASVVVPDPERVAYVTQTTLAVDEVEDVAAVLRDRFPGLRAPDRDDICYATTNRQAAVRAVAQRSDLVLVIGSANSSNSLRLTEVAEREGTPAHLVDSVTDVDLRWLRDVDTIGLTAGASAPESLVTDLVTALGALGPVTTEAVSVAEEDIEFTLPREVG